MRFTLFCLALSALPIAIRHDVPDARYLELGARFPSAVRVGANGGDGTLIAPEWVLTAAHVAEGMARRSGGDFRIFVDGDETGYAVRQIILHPDFAPMGPNDLALIRLDRPVAGVQPAALYRNRDEAGQTLVLVGHGDTKNGLGGEWVMDRKKRGATNVVDSTTSAHLRFDFDSGAAATPLEGTAGPGDSGGPAYILVDSQPYLAGVSSAGRSGSNGPGSYGAEEYYVRVSSHVKWIDDMLAAPPEGRMVNMPTPSADGARRIGGSPGAGMPQGVVMLDEIGLMVADRGGAVQMVGRVDNKYPDALLQAGIRPPSTVVSLNGVSITSASQLSSVFTALTPGSIFTISFKKGDEVLMFRLTK